jgi:hypothetical protein
MYFSSVLLHFDGRYLEEIQVYTSKLSKIGNSYDVLFSFVLIEKEKRLETTLLSVIFSWTLGYLETILI